MASHSSSIQSNKNYVPVYGSSTKNFATPNQPKLNKTSQGGNTVENWVEINRHLHDAIIAGTSDLSQPDQQTFMQWWDWSMSQIQAYSSNFDPMAGNDFGDAFGGDATAGAGVPEGAQLGANGNPVFRTGSATTTYSPSKPVDVLSDEFTLNVDVKVQDITVEKTKDTRLNPPEDVIKITVKDPYSQPSETVYFVHETDAAININTVGGEGVTVHGDIPNATVGEFSESQSAGAETDVARGAVKDAEGKSVADSYNYEVATVSEVINFTSQGGKDESHYVVGSANISVPVSSDVNVAKGAYTSPDGETYEYKLTVTHKDGKTDTYYLQDKKEFNHNINALSENVSSTAPTDGEYRGIQEKWSEGVPAEFKESFSLNANDLDVDAGANPDDTQPDNEAQAQFWDPKDVGAVYDSPTVDIHPNGTPSVIEVHANELNITLDSMMDEVKEIWPEVQANGHTFYQIVIKFKDGSEQTILVDKDAKINIDGKVREGIDIGGYPITINGETEDANGKVDPIIEDLAQACDTSVDTIREQIYEHFEYIASKYDADEDGELSIAELNKAIQDKAFPPKDGPNQDLLEFLVDIDDDFKRHLKDNTTWESSALMEGFNKATAELVEALQSLYPDMKDEIGSTHNHTPSGGNTSWAQTNYVTFGGMTFAYAGITDQNRDSKKGKQTDVNYTEV